MDPIFSNFRGGPGVPGILFTWRGAWTPGAYNVNDVVIYGGVAYVCTTPVNGIVSPYVDRVHWEAIKASGSWYNSSGAPAASAGDDGDYDLDLGSGNIYRKQSGIWVLIGQLAGSGQISQSEMALISVTSGAGASDLAQTFSAALTVTSAASTP